MNFKKFDSHGIMLGYRGKRGSLEIKKITNKDFNLNSPKQLSEILYVDMEYPIIKKTPKGAPSTDASVLEELSKSYELPKFILKYREYEKLRSTYIEGLKNEIVNGKTANYWCHRLYWISPC